MNGWKRRLESVRGAKSLLMYRSGKKYSREGSRTFNSVQRGSFYRWNDDNRSKNSARGWTSYGGIVAVRIFRRKIRYSFATSRGNRLKRYKSWPIRAGLAFENNERIVGARSRDRFPIFLCSFTREYTLSKNAMLRSFFHRGNHTGTALSPRIGLRYRRFDPLDARVDTCSRFDSIQKNEIEWSIERCTRASWFIIVRWC